MNLIRRNGTRTSAVSSGYTTLDVIDGNEGAFITANELIEQRMFSRRTRLLPQVSDVKNVEIRAVTGGIIETRGSSISKYYIKYWRNLREGKDSKPK
jgi:hypothetical protein